MNRSKAKHPGGRLFSPSGRVVAGSFAGTRPAAPSTFGDQKKIETPTLNGGSLRRLAHGVPVVSQHMTGTSRSSRSCSVVALEETIADVMGVRMQSLADLGARIEELSSLHRQEEDAFRQQVGGVLQQLEAARLGHLDMEQDCEALLKKERAERQAVISLMQRFKAQGAEVINTMKVSLQDARKKWKEELERNARLTAQLRHYTSGDASTDFVESNRGDESAVHTQARALHTKVETLTRLIEEEDAIIVELQQRNKALERKISVLIQQRDRLLDLEAQQLETEEFNNEYNSLLKQVRSSDANEDETSLQEKVEILTRFTKMVLQRLQAEQRQRLRVEEQTVRMASEHDQVVRALESRIKSIESQKTGRGPSYHHSGLCASIDQLSTTMLQKDANEKPVSSGDLSPAWDQTEGEVVPNLQADEKVNPPSCGFTYVQDAEPKGSESTPNDSTRNATHAELESKIEAVVGEFRQSIEDWSALPLDGGKPLREEDFYPD